MAHEDSVSSIANTRRDLDEAEKTEYESIKREFGHFQFVFLSEMKQLDQTSSAESFLSFIHVTQVMIANHKC